MTDNATPLSVKGVYTLCKPENGNTTPILCDSPHSGTIFPDDFQHICTRNDLLRFSDLYVDELIEGLTSQGITTLAALFPRTYIDANRRRNDIDEKLLEGTWTGRISQKGRASAGYGVIYRKAHDGTQIYKGKLSTDKFHQRLSTYYDAYHSVLKTEINNLKDEFGHVLHLNLHSMPSQYGFSGLPDIVLGNLNGVTCDSTLLNTLRDIFRKNGYSVALNHPYKGAEILRQHGRPHHGVQSIQIEINRKLYMDEKTLEKTNIFTKTKDELHSIINTIKDLYNVKHEDMVAD